MNLEHIIKTGSLVEVEFFPDEGPAMKLNTLVDHPYTNGVFTIYAPTIKGGVMPIHENDTLNIHFMVDNAEKTDKDIYRIKCHVDQRGYTNNIPVYKLVKLTEPEKIQRRGAFRLEIMKDFTMYVGEDKRVVHLTTNNISGTGLKSITHEKLEKNSVVILNLDTDLEVIQIPCTVVMSNQLPDSLNKFDTRLQFIVEKDMIAQKINAFLFRKQSEMIQKNIGPSGYSELYYKLNEKDAFSPEKIEGNQQSSILVVAAYVIMLLATFAIFAGVPKDPQIIFKTLLKKNIVYTSWNYTYIVIGTILAAINIPLSAFGIVIKRRYHLPGQMPYNVPLLICLVYCFFLLLYGLLNFATMA